MQKLIYHRGVYPIAVDATEKRALINTGSSYSTGRGLVWFGKKMENFKTEEIEGSVLTLSDFEKGVGLPLDAFIGGDILKNYVLTIDPYNRVIRTDFQLPENPEVIPHVPFELHDDVPVAVITANGHQVSAVIDTGSKHSYILPKFVEGVGRKGNIDDFIPKLGRFETDTVEIPIEVGPLSERYTFGVATAAQAMLMESFGSVILGADWMSPERMHLLQIDYIDKRFNFFPKKNPLVPQAGE